MKTYKVKDLMVPIDEYALVSEDASLYEAVITLENAQQEYDKSHYVHRAILVYDRKKKIVGKLSQLDVIRALEPKYQDMYDHTGMARYGFTKKFLQSMMDQYQLWNDSLENACRKSIRIRVGDIMYTPSDKEYVDVDSDLGEAIHMLIMGHHQSLLVTKAKNIVGILRLVDVFCAVSEIMKTCHDQGGM